MIELRSGSATASIDPVRGGRLASLSVAGRELLVGPDVGTAGSILWGSFLMAPWAGRIAGGAFDWNEERRVLPRNGEGHAIHGLVHDRAWEITSADCCSASLTLRLEPAAWPGGGTVRQTFELGEDAVTTTAEVRADGPMPAALGWHPWFRRGEVDPGVAVDAAEVLEADGLIPTGRRLAVDARTDLRAGPPVCERRLDHVYPDALSPAIIRWPDLELLVEFGPPLATLVVHSRGHAFCVEPQTAWPDAVHLVQRGVEGTGLVTLAAGERLSASMTIRWRYPA